MGLTNPRGAGCRERAKYMSSLSELATLLTPPVQAGHSLINPDVAVAEWVKHLYPYHPDTALRQELPAQIHALEERLPNHKWDKWTS